MDIQNKTYTSDHGSLTLEINSLSHTKDFGGHDGSSYHFTIEKKGQFGLEKEVVHVDMNKKSTLAGQKCKRYSI